MKTRSSRDLSGLLLVVSSSATVVGLVLFLVNHEATYCHRNPDAGPNGLVDVDCRFAEHSAAAVITGNTGFSFFLLGLLGVVISLVWGIRSEIRRGR